MAFRPALRPGAPLLRRDARHLQIGTSPGIVIADRPGLLTLLRLLDGVRDVPRLEELAVTRCPQLVGQVASVLTELMALEAVVDPSRTGPRRRRDAEVAVRHDGGSAALAAATRDLLGAAGVRCRDSSDPVLLVLVSYGEPPRTDYDRATLLCVDHLPVVIDEDRIRIGPLVRPGRTPCVGCHDLHRTDWDAAWPALLHQLGRTAVPIGAPAVSALTTQAAAVEVAAEVIDHLEGRAVRTHGRCVVVGPSHDQRTSWPVAFHHGCSCDLLNAA